MTDQTDALRSLIEQHHVREPEHGSSTSSSTSTDGTSTNPSPVYQTMSASSSEPTTPNFSLPGSYMSQGIPRFSLVGPLEKSINGSVINGGYIVPPNFGQVADEVYRSSFPRREHFPYLQTLGLRTVLTLVLEEYPDENRRFLEREGIELIQLGMPNNKDPHAQIPGDTIRKALGVVLDRRKYPMLIHCNRGKHRTGCLVGCLRKLQRWSPFEALDEYARYAHPKERASDQNFITSFVTDEAWASLDAGWLPAWISCDEVSATMLSDRHRPDGLTASLTLSSAQCGIKIVDGG